MSTASGKTTEVESPFGSDIEMEEENDTHSKGNLQSKGRNSLTDSDIEKSIDTGTKATGVGEVRKSGVSKLDVQEVGGAKAGKSRDIHTNELGAVSEGRSETEKSADSAH